MILYGWIQSSAMIKQQDVRWCGFRWSIPLSFGYVGNSNIDRAISTPSCSYCVWNRYCQNHRSIHPNFPFFAWFDMLEFNRLPCSNNKMYDDADFAGWFRYQLAMFGIRVLVWLSRLIHARILIWNRYRQNRRSFLPNFLLFAWFDAVDFNRPPCSNNKMYDDAVFVDRFWY